MLYLLSAVLVASIGIVTVVCRSRGRRAPAPNGTVRLKEPAVTLWMGGFLWLETAALIGVGFALPGVFDASPETELNSSLFLLLSIGLGSFLMLYGSIKRIDLSETGLHYVDPLGRGRSLSWEDVEKVEAVIGKRFVLHGRRGRIPVGGNRTVLRDCVVFAERHLDPVLTRDVFPPLKRSLGLP
jgi:hypothetical protein